MLEHADGLLDIQPRILHDFAEITLFLHVVLAQVNQGKCVDASLYGVVFALLKAVILSCSLQFSQLLLELNVGHLRYVLVQV